MNIMQALQLEDQTDVRITCGNAWMYWDDTTKEWVVLEHGYGKKCNTELYRGQDEQLAVAALVQDD